MTVTAGVIWEIIEYVSDIVNESNMQRAYVSTPHGRGEPFVGQAALKDTMKDLILDSIGAASMSIICGIAVITNKIKLEDLSFIKKHKKVTSTHSESVESHEELKTLSGTENSESILPEDFNPPEQLTQDSPDELLEKQEEPKTQKNKLRKKLPNKQK